MSLLPRGASFQNMLPEQRRREGQLVPERELRTADGYRWFYYSPDQVGMPLLCLEDLQTGVVVSSVFADPEKRTAAFKAWAGARHSRSPGKPWEIMQEMTDLGVDPDAKLEAIAAGVGHAAIGDLARAQLDICGLPIHGCTTMFLASRLHGGQEKSTRYQVGFGKAELLGVENFLPEGIPQAELHTLQEFYDEFLSLALSNFEFHRQALTTAYTDFYRPGDAKQARSLDSRVLDSVRFFLLWGQKSGLTYEASLREWSRMISELKTSPVSFYRQSARQIERFLTPTEAEEVAMQVRAEAPRLVRHSEPNPTVNRNLVKLKEFLIANTNLASRVEIQTAFLGFEPVDVELISDRYTPADRMVTQYILNLWPGFSWKDTMEWVHSQDDGTKAGISRIIFNGHSNYCELPFMAATTGMGVVVETTIGEARDLLRNRAWARFMPIPMVFGAKIDESTIRQILAKGYGLPLYLTEISGFAQHREAFEESLRRDYGRLFAFLETVSERYGRDADYSFMLNLLPLAHRVDLFMHGDPKQALYLADQRVRPGGHINYRLAAYLISRLVASSDPYLSAMRIEQRPDPANREEFFSRA